jgi:hypothetical protein
MVAKTYSLMSARRAKVQRRSAVWCILPSMPEPIRFVFDEKKALQAAAYLLKLNGGTMDYRKLVTLMYLADRELLITIGRTITGDEMVNIPDDEM